MDNVTHALAGFLLAEVAARLRAPRGERLEHWLRPAYASSAIANSLPDLDFLYARITQGPLGYLLHHRGHTHTIALAPPLALVAFAIGDRWLARSGAATRSDRIWLAALALAGALLHLVMDYSNSYGLHPFWPLYDGWLYGDAVFIIEPLLWATMLPFLLAQVRWWPGRLTLGALLAATLVLPWLSGIVPPALSALVVAVTLASSFATHRLQRAPRVLATCAQVFAVLAIFGGCSRVARARAQALLRERFPIAQTHDIVLSPLPANPVCWSLIAVQTERDRLIERRGSLSLVPGLSTASRCPDRMRDASTAPLSAVPGVSTGALALTGQFDAPLSELRALSHDCRFAALLRFARAPFWKFEDTRIVIGDLRFDRSVRLEFAELGVERTRVTCPRFVPNWTPPRAALLAAP